MSREVRRVPKDFQHPRDIKGHHIPLYDGDVEALQEKWLENEILWHNKQHPDQLEFPSAARYSFAEWTAAIPEPADYMPKFEPDTATHYMMYETTTEGTPISPAFETEELLARWLADNNASSFGTKTASYEGWLAMIKLFRQAEK